MRIACVGGGLAGLYVFACTAHGWIWAYAYGISTESSTFIVECPPETWAGLGFDIMPPNKSLALLEKILESSLNGHQLTLQTRDVAKARWLTTADAPER